MHRNLHSNILNWHGDEIWGKKVQEKLHNYWTEPKNGPVTGVLTKAPHPNAVLLPPPQSPQNVFDCPLYKPKAPCF